MESRIVRFAAIIVVLVAASACSFPRGEVVVDGQSSQHQKYQISQWYDSKDQPSGKIPWYSIVTASDKPTCAADRRFTSNVMDQIAHDEWKRDCGITEANGLEADVATAQRKVREHYESMMGRPLTEVAAEKAKVVGGAIADGAKKLYNQATKPAEPKKP